MPEHQPLDQPHEKENAGAIGGAVEKTSTAPLLFSPHRYGGYSSQRPEDRLQRVFMHAQHLVSVPVVMQPPDGDL